MMNRLWHEIADRLRIEPIGVAMPGARLPDRIRNIFFFHAGAPLARISRARAACISAICGTLCAALIAVSFARAQSDSQARLRFDAASVKLSADQRIVSDSFTRAGTYITWTTSPSYIMEYAYDLDWVQISTPEHHENVYTIDAVTDVSTSDAQLRQMLQSLLIDRFGLVAHNGQKDVDGYAITVAKGGVKMQEAKPDAAPPPMPSWVPKSSASYGGTGGDGRIYAVSPEGGTILVIGSNITMQRFSGYLQRMLDKPVVDKTNLPGGYYIAMEYSEADPSQESSAPSISTALKELGLNMEKYKGPADVLIVDQINEPTPN
jgi:uncharacterized protein (TIGR03435 family)